MFPLLQNAPPSSLHVHKWREWDAEEVFNKEYKRHHWQWAKEGAFIVSSVQYTWPVQRRRYMLLRELFLLGYWPLKLFMHPLSKQDACYYCKNVCLSFYHRFHWWALVCGICCCFPGYCSFSAPINFTNHTVNGVLIPTSTLSELITELTLGTRWLHHGRVCATLYTFLWVVLCQCTCVDVLFPNESGYYGQLTATSRNSTFNSSIIIIIIM